MTAPAWLTDLMSRHVLLTYPYIDGGVYRCTCGDWSPEVVVGPAAHRAHVAAVVWAEIEKRFRDARDAVAGALGDAVANHNPEHYRRSADAAIDAALTHLGADE